MNFKRAKMLNQ